MAQNASIYLVRCGWELYGLLVLQKSKHAPCDAGCPVAGIALPVPAVRGYLDCGYRRDPLAVPDDHGPTG